DRSWERGLHQMVEVKEGLPPGDERETLGKISYQLFFRRYLVLSGMTGTCREVAGELGEVYGLGVVRVPPYRPSRRRYLGARLFATADERWRAVVGAVQQMQQSGRPVLIGTRSIKASEVLAGYLQAAGIGHRVLNAKQDAEEADVVARAGAAGAVTIATNMAGRGTDVLLDDDVKMKGGLHVILTERHDNARVDRQLIGRCARQGDPGSYEIMLSLEDDLVVQFVAKFNVILSRLLQTAKYPLIGGAGLLYYRAAQRYVEWQHRRLRQHMLSADFRARQALSFSGQSE
ncbi:MAG: preprotein translocase subunit SecA, partial [Vogesella sp.]